MDQQFSLSWNNFHGNLSKGFAGLLGKGEFVDVTIAVEGHLIQAHKVILSICSPYFKKMFQTNPCQHPIVVLRDITHKAMRDLLQFMYHGEVSVKREDLNSFIGTAEVLQIKGLTNKETDEDDNIADRHEITKPNAVSHKHTSDVESYIPDSFGTNNDEMKHNEIDMFKQRNFIEKLQRLSNLKRKSEEFLQKNFYLDLLNTEKRPKLQDKCTYNKHNNHLLTNSSLENLKSLYDENPVNITSVLNTHIQNEGDTNKELKEKKDSLLDNGIELKTECDDSDIIVTEPSVCTTPKSYETSRDSQKEMSLPVDFQSPQDNCSSLSSLFIDLKNIVNGKMSKDIIRGNTNDEISHTLEHRLVTIPQKEDGKKKYPQRSCRLCWKIGRRRDTRFMCSACELPFCKTPCFGIHYNDIIKVSQLQGDYYAT